MMLSHILRGPLLTKDVTGIKISDGNIHLTNIQTTTVGPYLITHLTILRGFRAPLNHINSVGIVSGLNFVPVVIHINSNVKSFRFYLVMTFLDEWYFQYAVKNQNQS